MFLCGAFKISVLFNFECGVLCVFDEVTTSDQLLEFSKKHFFCAVDAAAAAAVFAGVEQFMLNSVLPQNCSQTLVPNSKNTVNVSVSVSQIKHARTHTHGPVTRTLCDC